MAIEKKESSEELGKARIAETLRAFQAAALGKEEKPAEDVREMALPLPDPPLRPDEPAQAVDADVLRFVETLKQARQKQVKPAPAAGSLDAIAQRLLDILYSIDPAWEQRDREVADEWGISPAQRVIKYCALVFDQQLHQNILHGYEFLEPGMMPAANPEAGLAHRMEAQCPQCHKTFTRKVPGQICCSNECGIAYFPPPERKESQFDDNFERFIESQNDPRRSPVVDSVRGPGMPVSGLVR